MSRDVAPRTNRRRDFATPKAWANRAWLSELGAQSVDEVLDKGLSWKDPAGRTRTETELAEWKAARGTTGRMAPRGFPRDNRFD